jgi:pilus assembly protein CpaB
MRAKSVLLLVLALGCGLIASIGISQVMDRKGPAPAEEVEKVQVFVAKVDIPKAELIKPEMVKLQEWPREMVPEDAITKLEQIENKQAHEKILANELIREARFTKTDRKVHIPPGFRVVAVKVSAEKGGHLLNVGDKVDLQVYLRQGSAPQITESMTRTFLRDVQVWAVGSVTEKQDADQVGNSAQTVSLLVRPKEAEMVTLAQRMGEISIVMKNASDTVVTNDSRRGVSTKDFFMEIGLDPGGPGGSSEKKQSFVESITQQLSKAKTPRRKTANQFVMLVVNGSEVVQYSFDDPRKPPVTMTAGTNRPTGITPDGQPELDPSATDGSEAPKSTEPDSAKKDAKPAVDPNADKLLGPQDNKLPTDKVSTDKPSSDKL